MKIEKYNVEIVGSVAAGKNRPKDIDFRTFGLPPTNKDDAIKVAEAARNAAINLGFRQGDLWFAWDKMSDEQVANRGYLEFNDDGWHLQLRGNPQDFRDHWKNGVLKSFRGVWE